MLKKLLLTVVILLVTACIGIFSLLAITKTGIKFSNGTYLGYSSKTDEWLFAEYPNTPVTLDGPYLIKQDNKLVALYVKGDGVSDSSLQKVEVTEELTVHVDGRVDYSFSVPVRTQHERSQFEFAEPVRWLAMSDLEGNFDATVNLLVANDVIGQDLRWRYGTGHLILVGDMVDRGNNVVPLLWLIYKLEAEAEQAGGKVHYVLGNHERYLLDGRTKSAARKYLGTSRITGLSPTELWGVESELGKWLRTKPAAVKVGDTLFVHGGISEKTLALNPSLSSIDHAVENELTLGNSIQRSVESHLLHDNDGILFDRTMASGQVSDAHVVNALAHFSVNQIAIGHTLAEQVGYNYGGKILRVDVDHSSGNNQALLMEQGKTWRVDNEGQKHLLLETKNLN